MHFPPTDANTHTPLVMYGYGRRFVSVGEQ